MTGQRVAAGGAYIDQTFDPFFAGSANGSEKVGVDEVVLTEEASLIAKNVVNTGYYIGKVDDILIVIYNFVYIRMTVRKVYVEKTAVDINDRLA